MQAHKLVYNNIFNWIDMKNDKSKGGKKKKWKVQRAKKLEDVLGTRGRLTSKQVEPEGNTKKHVHAKDHACRC